VIFLTVGTQLPFDRLVEAVATWSRRHADRTVFAQIGASALRPPFESVATLSGPDYARVFEQAEVVVAHVGIGTVLDGLRLRKPLICMPRDHARGEHRNDHQFATARHLSTKVFLALAWTESDVPALLDGPCEALVPTRLGSEPVRRLSAHVAALAQGLV